MRENEERPQGLILIGALLLDLTLGDPPNRFHPVAWMGSAIAAAQERAPRQGPVAQLAYGGLIAVGGALSVFGLGRLVEHLVDRLPSPVGWLVESVVLKSTFSVGRLGAVAQQIETSLDAQDVADARRLVSWHLVSRDTSELTLSQVAAATIESVAESASDGIMAPLLAYLVGGLPGALAYRFANTADSMLGYRDEAREWLGKIPARLDDVLNLIPARLTALLLTLGSPLVGASGRGAWRVWRRDRRRTASPNAGHPMSAMAGSLQVELEKVGHYRLGAGQRPPTGVDIGRAVRVLEAAVALGAALLIGLCLVTGLARRDQRVCSFFRSR
jgi:adenosylcobinamide-phosphate synthase